MLLLDPFYVVLTHWEVTSSSSGEDDSSLSELSFWDSSDCEGSESSSDSLFLGIGKQFLKRFTDESPGTKKVLLLISEFYNWKEKHKHPF